VGCWRGYLPGARCRLAYHQLMPLPLTVSCFSQVQIGFTFLVRLTRVVPETAVKRVCVCVCVVRRPYIQKSNYYQTAYHVPNHIHYSKSFLGVILPEPRRLGVRTGGGLGRAKPSQPLKLAPNRPNTTDVAPPHMSYHRKFLPVGVSVTISRTLAVRNNAGTNFINNYLRLRFGQNEANLLLPLRIQKLKGFQLQGGFAP